MKNPIDTSQREIFNQWGVADGLFIQGKNISKRPPVTKEKIRRQVEKELKKLKP